MNLRKYFILFILIIFLISFTSAGFFSKQKTCGDGTLEGNCSINQPYFCSEEILIERASICGCPNLTEINGDSCISPYQTNPKEINLKYFLKGEQKEINFTVYEGMADYLFELPDFITYSSEEEPSRADFKLRNINEENQKILLMPLVVKIQNLEDEKEDQARIAISLVQNIPYGGSNKTISLKNNTLNYSRYPYEVLYGVEGICGEKSELLAFLLKEIGYEIVLFYYQSENHESVGIKCSEKYGFGNTSYCFIETTGPSIITDSKNNYLEGIKLSSEPEIIFVSEGDALKNNMKEYRHAKRLMRIREKIENTGKLNFFRYIQLKNIRERYGLGGKI